MTSIAVIAHCEKTLGGGLDELRSALAHRGFDPLWFEISKSKHAAARARNAVDAGADLVFLWGGDGTVQRGLGALAGSGVAAALLPAGTANVLANDLGIPIDLHQAVDTGLHGRRRALDLGLLNGEHFAVMAGAGFDARTIRGTRRQSKNRFGRLAYVWNGARNLRAPAVDTTIEVDGTAWFRGPASCVLAANVGTMLRGLRAFPKARADDGVLEIGVVTAEGRAAFLRVLARLVAGRAERSPFVHTTSGRHIEVRFASKQPYELDGGARGSTKKLSVTVAPAAVEILVPTRTAGSGGAPDIR
jgi:YegS/Rv2252/BmrU family lipid kinase